jgi:outer membrane protein assembly factor BamB
MLLRCLFAAILFVLTSTGRTAPVHFCFAFLSDTHVGSSTGEEDLRATVQDINSMTGLSFVVISGDITEYGSREQLTTAKAILHGLHIPCHVIPGNHDTKWSESGATDFPRLWKDERFLFKYGGLVFIGMHQGPIMKMGDGYWSPQDVRWLENTLKKVGREQPVTFVTHYPIDDGIANWYEVLDLLKRYNVQAVLCGHGHANHHLNFEGLPGIMGRSNLRARANVGGFNLVDVADGRMSFSERVTGRETKAPWRSVALERHGFASETNRYPRPDFSMNERYPAVRERWSISSGYTIASSPAVWKDLCLFGDASGKIRALALDSGLVRWEFKTGGPVYSTPAVEGNFGITASTDGDVYALNVANGKELWRFKTTRPIVASPAIAGGRVYVGSSDGRFRALDLATGKLAWQFSDLHGFVEARPLVYEGKVVFAAWDQHLYALDAATGNTVWTWTGDKPGTLYSPAACWPVGAHQRVFIVAPDRMMTALDIGSGQQLWRTGDYVVRESIGLSEDASRFYVRAMNDYFYAFDTSADKPQKVWALNARFGYDINSAMLVEKGGTLFYGTKNGVLFALDGQTGTIQWEHKIGVGIVNTVAPLNANTVLATDCGGKVVLIENASTSVSGSGARSGTPSR